jgi:hypothetical protein
MRRRRAALLITVLCGGAALAAPLPVLELEGEGEGRLVYAVDPGATFVYEYRQSIYDVPVEEHFRVEDGRLRLLRVRSPHPAALEYFRWPGEVRTDGGWLSIDPPGPRGVVEDELVIRVAPAGGQRLRTRAGHVVRLDGMGAELLRVRASTRPLLAWAPLRVAQSD